MKTKIKLSGAYGVEITPYFALYNQNLLHNKSLKRKHKNASKFKKLYKKENENTTRMD